MAEINAGNQTTISIGTVEGHAAEIVLARSGVAVVNTVTNVREHWRLHADQFDVNLAEQMLGEVIRDPLFIYQDKKPNTISFVENFIDDQYLIIPIKCLPGELWVSTIYAEEKRRFHRRMWTKKGFLYERNSVDLDRLPRINPLAE